MRRPASCLHSWLAALMLSVIACGGGNDKNARNVVPAASSSSATIALARETDTAYKLTVAAASCWLGGLWGDAEGESGAAERRAGTTRRCSEVVKAVSGDEDPTKVEALRLLDPSITDTFEAKVKARASEDGLDDAHTTELEKLAAAVVSAAREAANARRAATKIRADIEKLKTDKDKIAARERDADKLSADEASAVSTLRAGAGLQALVSTSGDYAADGHAIGVMLALTRVRAAQDLPKHMKLYTVAPAYAAVFAVAPPALPEHTRDRLKPGTWLAYVMQVAKACGHPVPASATTAKEKEGLAWSGSLAGFSDRLQADEGQIKNADLLEAVRGAVTRLEARAKQAAEKAGSN